MGLVVNKPSPDVSLAGMLEQLGIVEGGGPIRLPSALRHKPVFSGGPVEPARGFVLHSSDYFLPAGTLPVNSDISLTATLDILQSMVRGEGPRKSLLALGYAGWSPGQLEAEIQMNGWLVCDADEDILFSLPPEEKYHAALKSMGITPGQLSPDAGHA